MSLYKHISILVEEALAERRCRSCKWRAKEPPVLFSPADKFEGWRECWGARDGLVAGADNVLYSPDFGCVHWEQAE